MPNGSYVFSYYDGTVQVFENVFIYKVLYIPDFA